MLPIDIFFALAIAAICGIGLFAFLRLKNQKDEVIAQLIKAKYEDALKSEVFTTELKTHNEALKNQNELLLLNLQNSQDKLNTLNMALATKEANLNAQVQKNEDMLRLFSEQKSSFKDELSTTMQNILEGKIEKFDQNSTKILSELLNPFKENLEGFKKKLEDGQKDSSEKFTAMFQEIEFVRRAGLSIADEAQKLAKALKGEKQTQGRWGEMILETTLEKSGLIKNEHYFLQESFRDDSGAIKRPDVVVKLPENRSIIIDSKVSLVDYERFFSAESDDERTLALNGLAKSFKSHIDGLSSKDYAHYDAGVLQYIFMFTPIESAYSAALRADPNLYEYALSKNIVIVYPSSLVVTLRVIYMYWQKERSDESAAALFVEAGKLYDKICLFLETFEKVGKQLDTLKNSYDQAAVQLFSGAGNIVRRAENIKSLGAKTTKSSKNAKTQYLLENDTLDDNSSNN
ncbi:MAG: recombination protein [Pseudomonadota bacterium]